MRQNSDSPICMSLVNRLISLLDSHPQSENTYILIGNYLIDHEGACAYFSLRMLGLSETARKMTHYKWALMILILRTEEMSLELLKDYDLALADIVSGTENEN